MIKVTGSFMLVLLSLMLTGCGGSGSSGSGSNDNKPPTRKISGSVTSAGTGLKDATVFLSGTAKAIAFTNSTGNYIFTDLPDGNYTVTPAKSGYTDTPRASVNTVNGADISNVNFTATASSKIFYVVDGMGKLGTVDIESGEVKVIGVTGSNSGPVIMTDIAFDPTGNLYGISSGELYGINKINAAITPIGNHNIGYPTSLVFSDCGTKLYTADNSLYTLDSGSGAATLIGNGGTQYSSEGDLAFIGDQLYLASKVLNDVLDTYLVKVDTVTGRGTLVGLVGFPVVFGIASNDNVNLYGFSGTKVISINTTTGRGTLLMDIGGKGLTSINGAAFN